MNILGIKRYMQQFKENAVLVMVVETVFVVEVIKNLEV